MDICIKKRQIKKIWFKFELPTARFLNFPKNSAAVLIRPVLIIGDCVYSGFQRPLVFYMCVLCNYEKLASPMSL